MNAVAETIKITPAQYLAGEQHASVRHEYVDGEIYAMAGGSDAHARIALNLAALLKVHLRGSGCSVYLGEMKAQVSDSQYFYPDVMVTCDQADLSNQYSKQHAKLLIEVLSPSTEAYDRGKKFEYYRQLASLEEYILISQTECHVDVFRKNAAQRWELFSFNKDSVSFASVDFSVVIEELYEDVDFSLAG